MNSPLDGAPRGQLPKHHQPRLGRFGFHAEFFPKQIEFHLPKPGVDGREKPAQPGTVDELQSALPQRVRKFAITGGGDSRPLPPLLTGPTSERAASSLPTATAPARRSRFALTSPSEARKPAESDVPQVGSGGGVREPCGGVTANPGVPAECSWGRRWNRITGVSVPSFHQSGGAHRRK